MTIDSKASTIAVFPLLTPSRERSQASIWSWALNLAHVITERVPEEGSNYTTQMTWRTLEWTIDNRYYTADVLVKVYPADSEVEELDGVPAIVLLVDANEAVETHQRYAEKMGERGWESEVGIVLALPGERGSGLDVYREKGWEIVTWGDDEEEGGIERVREACMATIWPGLKRKDEVSRHATPDETDQALALAFLTHLNILPPSGSGPLPLPSDESQLASLETFLESQPDWPQPTGFDDDFVSASDEGIFDIHTLREEMERVRSIQDMEERRTQAASIALSFLEIGL